MRREVRRGRGHPVLFVLVCFVVAGAVMAGAWWWAFALAGCAVWLVVRRG